MIYPDNNAVLYLNHIIRNKPNAKATIRGASGSNINGTVVFYTIGDKVLVKAQIYGLPASKTPCGRRIFAMHIHSGTSCSGSNTGDAFPETGMHYNPNNCPHPYHAGDLPPLFSNNGEAWYMYTTNRFTVKEIIGKTVVIHERPDDFTTQPSGNSGSKIACGQIIT